MSRALFGETVRVRGTVRRWAALVVAAAALALPVSTPAWADVGPGDARNTPAVPVSAIEPSAPTEDVPTDPSDPAADAPTDPAEDTGTADAPDPEAPPAEEPPLPAGMVETEKAAVSVVDGFWKRHYRELSGRTYLSPKVSGGYRGNEGPTCAGQPSVPFNAFYCRTNDTLAWDENLMATGYRQIGDSWVYLIIAHEWGHAIQARLRRGLTALSVELQADCLAGATLQGAADDGLVKVEPGDAEELRRTLAAAADSYPWTNRRDHGDAQQRIAAFNTGARNGLKSCF
jgi:predicted metalloprotease